MKTDLYIQYTKKTFITSNNNKFDFSFPSESPATSKCGLRHDNGLSNTAHVSMIFLFGLIRKYLFILNSSSVSQHEGRYTGEMHD